MSAEDTFTLWAQKTALELHETLGTWRAVAEALAPYLAESPAAWWHVGRGEKVSREKVNALRAYLGLPQLPRIVPVEACPKCGDVHLAPECARGKRIVVVEAGSKVQIVRRRPPQRWRDMPVSVLRGAIQNRVDVYALLPPTKTEALVAHREG
ncbi:MAG: hypothetical protein GXP39_08010 [Chloroflexi bacterium]|nr:hypothetical protein [Chloroflexota bacterium]